MASVLADAVVKKVCEMAIQQSANEVNIVLNFTDDFEWLKNRIEEINCVLNEGDEESTGQKDSVKKWLQRVRDVAWEAEDILEEYAVDSLYASNTQFCFLSCSQLILRHRMGRRIRKVKARMSSVVEDGNHLNIVRVAAPRKEGESSSSSQGQQFKTYSRLPSDSKPVGIQSKIESIVSLLQNPKFPIIAVVGMGGIGKTYLLQHVYNSRKETYEKSAWLSVSRVYSVSKLQRDLAFKLDEGLCKKINESGISEEAAAEEIHRFIQGKRCLIVLDDVWRATTEGDLPIKLGIPTGKTSQCKILISTRSIEVCVNIKAQIYEMERLTYEDSWRLFRAYAFPESEENTAPKNLEEVARNIAKKCGELPLAIKITAASLANTTRPRDWQSKFSKLIKVEASNDHVMDVLKLSYHTLPAHLRACFAYLSFFPEDEVIECEYLVYLWMGEGFIPIGKNPWDCLDRLANLCLIEVWEEEWSLKKYCKIHDLLLDLAILISRENRCAFSLEDAFSKLYTVNIGEGSWCRLFLAKKDIDEHDMPEKRLVSPTLVRTLSLSRNREIGGNIPAMLFRGMRVLRVLDLSHTNISTLPTCIGEMKLLKVLNLRETKIEKLPECVRCLKSLSFLDVSHCSRLERNQAPRWISELKCLRHLAGPFQRMPNGISKLESLRILRISKEWLSLSIEEDGMLRLEDVGKMNQIEEIAFRVEDESQLKGMEEGMLAPLLKMLRLQVENKVDGMRSNLPEFPERMSVMKDLEHLKLEFFAVPGWICCLENLRYLYLSNCDGSNYPELQAMPNLVTLVLWWNKSCKELPKAFGKSGGFPQLRFFSIHDFPQLEGFPEVEDGAMASLEKLELWRCTKVNKVGEGLERLKQLKEFNFEFSGINELKEMLKDGGKYWNKMKAVNPQVIIRL